VAHTPFVTLAGMKNVDELVNVHGLARLLRLPVNWLTSEAKRGTIPW